MFAINYRIDGVYTCHLVNRNDILANTLRFIHRNHGFIISIVPINQTSVLAINYSDNTISDMIFINSKECYDKYHYLIKNGIRVVSIVDVSEPYSRLQSELERMSMYRKNIDNSIRKFIELSDSIKRCSCVRESGSGSHVI